VIFYFGCWSKEHIGHYLYDANGLRPRFNRRDGGVTDHWETIIPWGFNLDGGLTPLPRVFGLAAFHQLHSFAGSREEKWWSALSWWDSSADTRPGSSSTFIMNEKESPSMLLALAREKFPTIFARFDFEVALPRVDG